MKKIYIYSFSKKKNKKKKKKKEEKSALAKKKRIGERSEPRVTVQLASLAEPGPRLPLRMIMNGNHTHKLLKTDAGTFQVCNFLFSRQ